MNATMYISLALGLLKIVLDSAGVKGLSGEVIADVQAAVDKLHSVQGTPVTWKQLDDLRVQPKW